MACKLRLRNRLPMPIFYYFLSGNLLSNGVLHALADYPKPTSPFLPKRLFTESPSGTTPCTDGGTRYSEARLSRTASAAIIFRNDSTAFNWAPPTVIRSAIFYGKIGAPNNQLNSSLSGVHPTHRNTVCVQHHQPLFCC